MELLREVRQANKGLGSYPHLHTTTGGRMNLNQGKLVDNLVEDLLSTIHEYDDSLYMATVIGCLEFVKQQLIAEAMEQNNG
jgi:hypothetical protein